ncbi:tyrosine-type recombinase/integrase [Vibrio splendidus]
MSSKKHLRLRGNIWWYQRRVPKQLKHLYPNENMITESLETGDLKEAQRKRDMINGRLAERQLTSPNPSRQRFHELVHSLKEDKMKHPYSWDEPYDYEKLASTDETFLHALTTVSGHKDQNHKYRITLNEGLNLWLQHNKNRVTKDTLGKVKRATSDFLKYMGLIDIQIPDITKLQVHNYINHQHQSGYKKATIQGHVSRLRSIWNHCDRIGEVTGHSPFDNHEFPREETEKKQPFTINEMEWIKANVAINEPLKRLLVELGVFTGCRISELCSLRCKNIIVEGDITAIFIDVGKTKSATRIVPLTTELGERVRQIKEASEDEDLVLGNDAKKMGRWFSRIKTDNISTDSAKCFHSFRVMFSTAMQQSGVDELKAAAILGHKRGNTMTYGYYSRGYELQQLKDAYDQCVERIIW